MTWSQIVPLELSLYLGRDPEAVITWPGIQSSIDHASGPSTASVTSLILSS